MPWFVVVADLLLSTYGGFTRREVWQEIPLAECSLYVRAIVERRMRENGQENEMPVDITILDLLDTIDVVKAERKLAKEQNGK